MYLTDLICDVFVPFPICYSCSKPDVDPYKIRHSGGKKENLRRTKIFKELLQFKTVMGVKPNVICTVFFVVVDFVVTTVLYIHGSQLVTFRNDVLHFSMLQSVLDIWGTVLLRASLLLGASIGVSWNREDGPNRVAKLTTPILLICLVITTYTLAKLLMLTEVYLLSKQPWLLSLLCWTCASSLGVMGLWRLLGRESSSTSRGSGEPGRSEDTEKLMEAAGEEEEVVIGCERRRKRKEDEGNKENTNSGATLGRLLKYCRKDSGLLSLAFLFLLISAVCECPFAAVQLIHSLGRRSSSIPVCVFTLQVRPSYRTTTGRPLTTSWCTRA